MFNKEKREQRRLKRENMTLEEYIKSLKRRHITTVVILYVWIFILALCPKIKDINNSNKNFNEGMYFGEGAIALSEIELTEKEGDYFFTAYLPNGIITCPIPYEEYKKGTNGEDFEIVYTIRRIKE